MSAGCTLLTEGWRCPFPVKNFLPRSSRRHLVLIDVVDVRIDVLIAIICQSVDGDLHQLVPQLHAAEAGHHLVAISSAQ